MFCHGVFAEGAWEDIWVDFEGILSCPEVDQMYIWWPFCKQIPEIQRWTGEQATRGVQICQPASTMAAPGLRKMELLLVQQPLQGRGDWGPNFILVDTNEKICRSALSKGGLMLGSQNNLSYLNSAAATSKDSTSSSTLKPGRIGLELQNLADPPSIQAGDWENPRWKGGARWIFFGKPSNFSNTQLVFPNWQYSTTESTQKCSIVHLVLKRRYEYKKYIYIDSKVHKVLKSSPGTEKKTQYSKQSIQVDLSVMYSQKQVSTPKSSRARRCQSEDRSVVSFPSLIFVLIFGIIYADIW